MYFQFKENGYIFTLRIFFLSVNVFLGVVLHSLIRKWQQAPTCD